MTLCTYFSQVDMLSLHDEGHRVRLEDIYVPIKTVTYKKTAGREEKKTLNHYTEMFIPKVVLAIAIVLFCYWSYFWSECLFLSLFGCLFPL